MKGRLRIQFTQTPYIPPTITNNRSLIVLVAPFKDHDWEMKVYTSMKHALIEEETNVSGAEGYNFLRILDSLGVNEIVLINLTRGTSYTPEPSEEEPEPAPVILYDYDFTPEKWVRALEILEDSVYNILINPYGLYNPDNVKIYKDFWTEKISNQEGTGLVTQLSLSPTEPDEIVDYESRVKEATEPFVDGGIYAMMTTPLTLRNRGALSLEESTVWLGGFISKIQENHQHSMRILDDVNDGVTNYVYTNKALDAVVDNGAVGTIYLDKIRMIIAIANANTPTDEDLQIVRVYHYVMNELRMQLLTYLGQKNTVEITIPELISEFVILESKMVGGKYITRLDYDLIPVDTNKLIVDLKVVQDDIIHTIPVYADLITE